MDSSSRGEVKPNTLLSKYLKADAKSLQNSISTNIVIVCQHLVINSFTLIPYIAITELMKLLQFVETNLADHSLFSTEKITTRYDGKHNV